MKSRMAITSMLILGVLAGGTGTGLAVSGVSDSGSAGKAQYPTTPIATTDEGASRPDGAGGSRPDGEGGSQGDQARSDKVLGQREGAGADGGAVQANRQVAVQEKADSLPFTGLAAIPLILIGVALLASGVVLRRRLPESS